MLMWEAAGLELKLKALVDWARLKKKYERDQCVISSPTAIARLSVLAALVLVHENTPKNNAPK